MSLWAGGSNPAWDRDLYNVCILQHLKESTYGPFSIITNSSIFYKNLTGVMKTEVFWTSTEHLFKFLCQKYHEKSKIWKIKKFHIFRSYIVIFFIIHLVMKSAVDIDHCTLLGWLQEFFFITPNLTSGSQ